MDFTKSIVILIPSIFTTTMTNRFMAVAPFRYTIVDVVFVRIYQDSSHNRQGNRRENTCLLYVRQHLNRNLPTTFNHPYQGEECVQLLSQFQQLRGQYWGRHIWGGGHFCHSSGNVTDEVIKAYIGNRKHDVDDNFRNRRLSYRFSRHGPWLFAGFSLNSRLQPFPGAAAFRR